MQNFETHFLVRVNMVVLGLHKNGLLESNIMTFCVAEYCIDCMRDIWLVGIAGHFLCMWGCCFQQLLDKICHGAMSRQFLINFYIL